MDNGYDDMDLQLIGYMYTYLMYTYVRSGQVGTVHIHIHIYAGTRQQDRQSFLTVVYIPESPVPIKYLVSSPHVHVYFHFQFTSRPALPPALSPALGLNKICPDITYLYILYGSLYLAVPDFYGY